MKHGTNTMNQHDQTLAGIVAVGVAVALGKLMLAAEPITWRALLGRSLVGGTTALVAGVALAMFTDWPPAAIYGVASMCAHLGAEGLMAAFGNYLNRQKQG